jgi:hypothetical protein
MPYYNIGIAEAYRGPMTITYDAVPLDEVEVRRGEHVHATDGIRLNLTKQQVQDLPPVDVRHPAG